MKWCIGNDLDRWMWSKRHTLSRLFDSAVFLMQAAMAATWPYFHFQLFSLFYSEFHSAPLVSHPLSFSQPKFNNIFYWNKTILSFMFIIKSPLIINWLTKHYLNKHVVTLISWTSRIILPYFPQSIACGVSWSIISYNNVYFLGFAFSSNICLDDYLPHHISQ